MGEDRIARGLESAAGWGDMREPWAGPSFAPATSFPLVLPVPAAGSLCKLRVKIRNNGDQDATNLVFGVKIGGTELPVYKNNSWARPIPAGDHRRGRNRRAA